MTAHQRNAAITKNCLPTDSAGEILAKLSDANVREITRNAMVSHLKRHLPDWWEGRKREQTAKGDPVKGSNEDRVLALLGRLKAPGIRDTAPESNAPGVHLENLRNPEFRAECRFPLWKHTESPTMMFCGEPATRGSYCEHHAAICFDKVALKPALTTKERKAA